MPDPASTAATGRSWNEIVRPYTRTNPLRSTIQLALTVAMAVGLWLAMLATVDSAYWLTLILAVPAGLAFVRLFIIQHDCGHGSFFRSKAVNDTLGSLIGIATLVPYSYWRKTHAIHHATSGDLDRQEFGDINTYTVERYLSLPWYRRAAYRVYRNPAMLLMVGPTYQFVLKHRFPFDIPFRWKKAWASVAFTNVALIAVVVALSNSIGLGRFLAIQIPIVVVSGAVGVFLFYVQHQYEDTYWRRHPEWNYHDAGLQGSSMLVMPRILHWFTANIGFHHIHHVCSKIPNYYLPRCWDENPEFRRVTRLTLREAVKTLPLALWDEDERRLVSFGQLKSR